MNVWKEAVMILSFSNSTNQQLDSQRMITRWIQRKGHDRLLIFFNGWGMDGAIAAFLQSNTSADFDHDVLLCYDYRSTAMHAGILGSVGSYTARTLVAWSLGVWAAGRAGLDGIDRALAINGTLTPVNDDEGIPPDLFRATLEGYDEENRRRFMRRMCGSNASLGKFSALAPQRDARDQKGELACILRDVLEDDRDGGPSWNYTHALVGGRDMIFPPEAQQRAWHGIQCRLEEKMPHFPFFEYSSWQEICACME